GRRVPHGGRDLLRELGAGVADRVDARDVRLHVLVGDEVAVLVVIDVIGEEIAPHRLEADEHEHAVHVDALGPAIALDLDPLHVAVAAHGHDDRVRADGRAVGEFDDLPVFVDADLLHGLVRLDLEAEFERVLGHPLGELRAGDRLDAGIVLDELRVEDLAAEILLLHEERAHVRAGRVEPRGKSGGTTADDDEIEVGQRRSFPGSSLTLEQLGIPERYLALGDSFTIGTGTTPDRSFTAVLVRLWCESGRAVELRNPAVNGYTTDDLIREELPLITAFRPTF